MAAGDESRHRPVRAGGAADPPAREAAHPGRAGHRRRVRSVRGGPRLDGEGGQGRLPGQAGARGCWAPRPRASGSSGSRATGRWVPPEGASVVHDGIWVGRVTSARRSAAAGAHRGPRLGARRAGRTRGRRSRSSSAVSRAKATVRAASVLRPRGREAAVVSDADPPLAALARCTRTSAPCWRRGGLGARRDYGDEADERARCCETASASPTSRRGARSTSAASLDGVLSAAGEVLARGSRDDWALVLAAPGGEEVLVPKLASAAGPGAMVTDVTHLFVGFALAGPALPDALARLTSWDPASLAAGAATGAPIADVRAVVVRRDLGSRCSRSTSRPSSRGTRGRRCSTRRAAGRRAGRLAGAPRGGVA